MMAVSKRPTHLVLCLDGAQRSTLVLQAAVLLEATDAEVSVLVVAAPEGAAGQLSSQLAAHGIAGATIRPVADGSEMARVAADYASAGALPILATSGNGTWLSDEVLHALVAIDVARALIVGPSVDPLGPIPGASIVIALDTVAPTNPLVETAAMFSTPETALIVSYVVPPTDLEPGFTVQREAAKFASALDLEVEVCALAGDNVAVGVADVAQSARAGLIVARSWHLHDERSASSTSASVAIAAVAPCPVLIVH